MFRIFGSNSNSDNKKSAQNASISEITADKTPIFKSKRFSHNGDIKLELIADNVATFEIDGKEEIADSNLRSCIHKRLRRV